MDSHPFSAAYWHMAAGELKNVRKLTFAALCMALCMALSAIPSVPLWGGAKITWCFLARAVCAVAPRAGRFFLLFVFLQVKDYTS